MNNLVITNAKYRIDDMTGENTCIVCQIGDRHCSVPMDLENADYAEIVRQLEAGTLTIADAD